MAANWRAVPKGMPVFCESGATEGKRVNRNRTTALRRENATFAGKPFSWKHRHSDERRPQPPLPAPSPPRPHFHS